jgi:transmembrane sensor
MSHLEACAAEAARWDARLRACDCTDADREAFAAWRSLPGNDAAYARLQAALTLLRSNYTGAEMVTRRRGWGSRQAGIGLAASFAAALLIGGWLAARPAPDMTVSAPAAAERSIRFGDGSAMLLAPGSTMKLHYAGDVRRATLVSGSARLVLASDQKHPFILYAADRRVTTAGSELSVRLSPGRVRIGLLRGAARVHCWHGLLPSDMSLRVGQRLNAEIGSNHARLETIT